MDTHLKGVLRHSREAVIGGASGDGADAELTDLIGLTELRKAFRFHHAHETCRGNNNSILFIRNIKITIMIFKTNILCEVVQKNQLCDNKHFKHCISVSEVSEELMDLASEAF